jgi:uncharacterized spore protein YtfJ
MAIDDKLSNIVGELMKGVSSISNSETIVGDAHRAGDATVIPVHRLKVAFGVGSTKAGAHHKQTGGDWGGQAAGGAIEVEPVAAIAIGRDGVTRLLAVDADEGSATWANLLKEVPDLLRKVAVAAGERATALAQRRADDKALAAGEAQALPEKTTNEENKS